MEPHLPIYHRPPNSFLRYEERRFDDGAGNTGTKRIALYQDKNWKQREETAQVIWDVPNAEITGRTLAQKEADGA